MEHKILKGIKPLKHDDLKLKNVQTKIENNSLDHND